MRRLRVPAAWVGLAALLVGGVLARASDRMRPAPRTRPGAGALFGGFTALAVHALWLEADEALRERRDDDAQLYLVAITDLVPQLVEAADYAAQQVGVTMAEGHADGEVRWALTLEGRRILSEAVARTPGEPRALVARAGYTLRTAWAAPELVPRFERDVDREGPWADALRDLAEARRLAPEDLEVADLTATAARLRGIELVAGERFEEAAQVLRLSAEAASRFLGAARAIGAPEEFTETREYWRGLALSLAGAAEAPPAERAERLREVRAAYPEAGLGE